MAEYAYEHQKKPDGTVNPNYVDLLEEDKAISGQKFVCVSFVSPETVLKKRELFMFEEFLKGYDFHSRASDIHNTNFIYLDESDKEIPISD